MNHRSIIHSWNNLSLSGQLELRPQLENYIRVAAKAYSLQLDEFEFHHKICNHKDFNDYKNYLKEVYAFIDWNMDLHQSDSNYTDFKDTLSEILITLANQFDDFYQELMQWSMDKNVLLIAELNKLLFNE